MGLDQNLDLDSEVDFDALRAGHRIPNFEHFDEDSDGNFHEESDGYSEDSGRDSDDSVHRILKNAQDSYLDSVATILSSN